MNSIRNIWMIFKRETITNFTTPMAYVVITIFVLASLGLAFFFSSGGLLDSGDASLEEPFFSWHPWLYLVLAPLVAMRLWSEEIRQGTSEWLFTMPIETWQAVIGKYLASLMVWVVALALTFPIVVTLYNLGNPDPGPIWSGYLVSFLHAAACLALTSAISTFTRSQTVAAILSIVLIFLLMLIGFPPFTKMISVYLPKLTAGLAYLSLFTHFTSMTKGLVLLSELVYYISFILFGLIVTNFGLLARRA